MEENFFFKILYWCEQFFLNSLLNLLQYYLFFLFVLWACGILVPWQGLKSSLAALEGDVLITGPSGKSLDRNFFREETNVSQLQF